MSEKTAKRAKPKAAGGKDDAGVLGNLPATRANRFGGERSSAAAKPKPATRAKPKPKAAAKPKAETPRPRPTTAAPNGPRPVRAGAPALKESTDRARADTSEPLEHGATPPSGTELVTTAIQAAGELAQIGLTVGGQVLKRTLRKLPKP
jgi:hypothetical protein